MERRYYFVIASVAALAAIAWRFSRTSESIDAVPLAAKPNAAAVGEMAADASERTEPPPARKSVSDVTPEVAPLDAGQPEGSAGTTALPIDVSPGFEFLGKPAGEIKDTDFQWSNWRRHQQLQAEPRDDAWAPRMEAALRVGIQSSLTARGLDTQRIELPVVECRMTGCEIQAVGYSADNGKDGVDLQTILPRLLSGPLANEFDLDQYSVTLSAQFDPRVTYLAQLPRKKP